MATERDSPRPTSTGHTHSTATVSAPREQADELATVNAGDAASLLAEHRAWWCDWWNASAVNLGEWQLIEKNYFRTILHYDVPDAGLHAGEQGGARPVRLSTSTTHDSVLNMIFY